MERTKSNTSPISGEKKNVFCQMIELWKADVKWNNHTEKERKVCIWFALSLVAVLTLAHTWLLVPALVSMVCCLGCLKDLKVEE